MAAASSVPRPSCSSRFKKLVTPAYVASGGKGPSNPEITDLLRQLMHVQQESLSRLIKWSESTHAHRGHGSAVTAAELSGHVKEMKHIISQSTSIICTFDECFSKLPSVPEPHSPPPPPLSAPGYPPYPPQQGALPATGYLPGPPPGYLERAQQYPASGSFPPHPPTHPPPGQSQSQWQDAGRDYNWDVDARQQAEKRRRTGRHERDEAYESEKLPKYKAEASEAEIQDFLAGLPKDVLSANEVKMCVALVAAWKKLAGMSNKLGLLTMCKTEAVRKAKPKLLPPGISVERWMEARIPELFEFAEGHDRKQRGLTVVSLKESQEDRDLRVQEHRDAKENAASEFFEALPEDDLSAEEHDMYDALLEAWKVCAKKYGIGKVRFSHIGSFPDVKKAKAAFLPEVVTLRRWIEARIGELLILSAGDDEQLMATFPDGEQ